MTQLELAKKGILSKEMKYICKKEAMPHAALINGIKKGHITIIKNKKRDIKPCAVGKGLHIKVNANIGMSKDNKDIGKELKKLRVAVEYKADAVMDLSTTGGIRKLRKLIIKNSDIPLGTVPIYEAITRTCKNRGHLSPRMKKEDLLEIMEEQASDGVDFFTVHCGVTQAVLTSLKKQKRLIPIVSRGGAFIAEWMILNKKENPMYEYFEDILKIAKKYDITLSLGDGLRPGTIIDATDKPQIHELKVLGKLAEKARQNNVQVIIEGPGHIPLNQIEENIKLQKKICNNAPFYVLGPLVTDIAPGYDHIVGAIGGAIAAFYGADFLCYLTPSEHLRIPDENDVKEGVIASRIAAHAADIAKGIKNAEEWDRDMSYLRFKRDWAGQIKKSIDKIKAENYRKSSIPDAHKDVCTMCSDYCSMKTIERYF